MKSAANKITSMILLVMATTSLITMFLLLQIDGIVRGELFSYGLQFSAQWAVPYWTIFAIMFAVGWSNIISALALQLYIYVSVRRETRITSLPDETPNGTPLKQTWEEQHVESTGSENLALEGSNLPEGLEQKTSSREENEDAPVSASAGIVESAGLTYVEESIYDAVVCYFHPDTEGQSFKTDFPDREFKQNELMRSYREKRISKDEYVEGLIKAFPLRLEQDISNKILDYLEGGFERTTNAEESLAIVKECRQDMEKWNALWKKICSRYETELLENSLAAQQNPTSST